MIRSGNITLEHHPQAQSQSLLDDRQGHTTAIQLQTYSERPLDHTVNEQVNSDSDRDLLPHHSTKVAVPNLAAATTLPLAKFGLGSPINPSTGAIEHGESHKSCHVGTSLAGNAVSDNLGSGPEETPAVQGDDSSTDDGPGTCQSLQTPSLDYRDPRSIPGTDLYLFPHAQPGQEFNERYPHIINLFKSAVDNNRTLKHHTAKIDYDLRTCGRNHDDAHPTIVVFCSGSIFKDLRKLLNCEHIRRQYQTESSLLRSKLPFVSSVSSTPKPSPVIITFRLVFWRVPGLPADRRAKLERVHVRGRWPNTLCGSLMTYENRSSTLALIVSLNSKSYGLTVDHVFSSHSMGKDSGSSEESEASFEEDRSEGNTFDRKGGKSDPEGLSECWTDDVKYGNLEYDGMDLGAPLAAQETPRRDAAIENPPDEQNPRNIIGHKLDLNWAEDRSRPYLDWALIDFEDPDLRRVNAFYTQDAPEQPNFLSEICSTPVLKSRPIYMISGVSGTRDGVLVPGHSYMGGSPGQDLCRALNVILSDSTGGYWL
jgi:hypothetical protein